MINIFLCDNDPDQLNNIMNSVSSEIAKNDYNMNVVFSCSKPEELLLQAKKYKGRSNLYFLDIELEASINGIELAHSIRKFDPRAYIVMVTAYADYMPITFSYMIEPLAYILKGDPSKMDIQISSAIRLAWERHKQTKSNEENGCLFSVNTKARTINLNSNDLYYITTSSIPHILEICGKKTMTQARGTINESLENLPKNFIKISRETIINIDYVKSFDPSDKSVTMINDSYFQVSTRQSRELKNLGLHLIVSK